MKTLQYATILVVLGVGGILCAFPVYAGVWYVDKAAPPDGNGESWATAFSEIQPAIDAAYNDGGGEVWVAAGTYSEWRSIARGAVLLRDDVAMFGGFSGSEVAISQRDWLLNETVIDGSASMAGSRAEQVVILGKNTQLSGFTVQGGLFSGIRIDFGDNAIVAHCRIRDNVHTPYAFAYGAIDGFGGVNVRIERCLIFENGGRGISLPGPLTLVQSQIFRNAYASYLYSRGLVRVSECIFSEHNWGALVLISDWRSVEGIRIERCVFWANSSAMGGAVFCDQYDITVAPFFVNCVFSFNTAIYYPDTSSFPTGVGGAVFSYMACPCDDKGIVAENPISLQSTESDEGEGDGIPGSCPFPRGWGCCSCPPNFINCTFVGNRADRGGGAIYFLNDWTSNWDGSPTKIANCIFWDNGEEPLGGALSWSNPYYPDLLSYCIIEGGFPGTSNYSFDPKFVDAGNGDYRLRPDSPAIDRGRDTSLPEFGGVVDDMFGCPRGYDGDGWPPVFGDGSDYDIGAYEYVPGCTPLLPWQHAADRDSNGQIELSELLRVIQFYQSGAFHCVQLPDLTEDGYDIGPGDQDCAPHSSDYAPQDWRISLREILRLIQLYNSGGYHFCPEEGTEDGFCPGPG